MKYDFTNSNISHFKHARKKHFKNDFTNLCCENIQDYALVSIQMKQKCQFLEMSLAMFLLTILYMFNIYNELNLEVGVISEVKFISKTLDSSFFLILFSIKFHFLKK